MSKETDHSMDGTKQCNRCGITKPLDDFYKKTMGKYAGRPRPYCKPCEGERTKEWRHRTGVCLPREERMRLKDIERQSLIEKISLSDDVAKQTQYDGVDMDSFIEIELTHGKISLVDECDSDLAGFCWQAYNDRTAGADHWYAKRGEYANCKTHQILSMHRIIIERILGRTLVNGEDVDHINRDGLDNRRRNLRVASRSQNCMNRPALPSKTSSFKGVHRFKRDGNWQAQINYRGHKIHLGYFDSEEDAAKAYDAAAKRLCPDFCYLNFPAEVKA